MVDFIKGLLSGDAGISAQVVGWLVLTNAVLSGIRGVLDAIKDRTAATWDNKASDVLCSILGWGSKVVDFIQGNVKH